MRRQPGQLGTYSFKFTLTAGTLAFVAICVLIAGYVFFKNKQDKAAAETIDFVVKAIGTGLAIVSAIYVGDNIRSVAIARIDEERLRKIDRALKVIERWNSPSYKDCRTTIEKMIEAVRKEESDVSKQAATVKHKMHEDPEFRTCAREMLNFLEEVGLTVVKEFADEDLLKDYFSFIFLSYAKHFTAWIEQRQSDARMKGTPEAVANRLYENFISINKRWNP